MKLKNIIFLLLFLTKASYASGEVMFQNGTRVVPYSEREYGEYFKQGFFQSAQQYILKQLGTIKGDAIQELSKDIAQANNFEDIRNTTDTLQALILSGFESEGVSKLVKEVKALCRNYDSMYKALGFKNTRVAIDKSGQVIGGASFELDPNNLTIYLRYRWGEETVIHRTLMHYFGYRYPWMLMLKDKGFLSYEENVNPSDLGLVLLSNIQLDCHSTLENLVANKKERIEIDNTVKEHPIWKVLSVSSDLPKHGFKIHVSARLGEEARTFQLVSMILDHYDISYKVCRSEEAYQILNRYEFEQGKLMSIFPRNDDEAAKIAFHIDRAILYAQEQGFLSKEGLIPILTDKQIGHSGALFTRYGQFFTDGNLMMEIKDKNNNVLGMVEDERLNGYKPDLVSWEPEWDKFDETSVIFVREREELINLLGLGKYLGFFRTKLQEIEREAQLSQAL